MNMCGRMLATRIFLLSGLGFADPAGILTLACQMLLALRIEGAEARQKLEANVQATSQRRLYLREVYTF